MHQILTPEDPLETVTNDYNLLITPKCVVLKVAVFAATNVFYTILFTDFDNQLVIFPVS